MQKARLLCILLVNGLVLSMGCNRRSPELPPEYSIDLQEGFSGEEVQILVDGKSIYAGNPQTFEPLGFAEEFGFDSESNTITLTVVVPAENVNSAHSLDLSQAKCIGISIENGIVEIIQGDGFAYE